MSNSDYMKRVSQAPPLVVLTSTSVNPTSVEIAAGQTIVWAVEEGSGLSLETAA